ncbi:glycogen phosphorylase [filamentous cyanobacterium CCP5]|nr:glycogen phosphorylase [filamentous cyanobacterium CCP5]
MHTAQPQVESFQVEDDRTGLSVEALKRAFLDNLYYVQGKFPQLATKNDYYMALAYTVRDRILQRWINTAATYTAHASRTVAYLSAEFLMGPQLGNNLINLGIEDTARQAMDELGLHLDDLLNQEEEPGLGNGGLGRLAACYQDSMATLELPAIGYGIRYEFGIFRQAIRDGWQVEHSDKWLRPGNPWELKRPEWAVPVKLGGHTETYADAEGNYRVRWIPSRVIEGVPYDTPILGYKTNTCNTLRLWSAQAPEQFDFDAFNSGDYVGAVQHKLSSENISKVLYPNDNLHQGKQLRLAQQIFFVSCSLQDMIRILKGQGLTIDQFHEKFTVQLNDTHPAVSVAELMRLLMDDHGLDWDRAWSITQKTFAYTNHTLMPEALERWPVSLFGAMLPRHLEIIYELNHRFLEELTERFPEITADKIRRLSLIEEDGGRSVRMANLACLGSFAINGVAALHTELLKKDVLRDFYELYPEKFNNKTNGITPRRFIALSNPRQTELVNHTIGDDWIRHLEQIKQLEPYANDAGFRDQWHAIKRANKRDLATYIMAKGGIVIDPDSMFDIQVKRIHEYKRQHLTALHIISLYQRLKANPGLDIPPRTILFGGKAAPGYWMAKLIIKLITSIADVVNNDPAVNDRLKVVFLENFNVKLAQHVYPAADLSEQVSMAGKEASGTGNMKFALNGALTIGTLDGANVEIREEVGAENFFLFGLTAPEVYALKASGYSPFEYYQNNPELRGILDRIAAGDFSNGDRELFKPLVENLLYSDPYLLLADYDAYIQCQNEVSDAFRDRTHWTRMSILNAARSGKFSSDRSIGQYADEVWKTRPVKIDINSTEVASESGLALSSLQ